MARMLTTREVAERIGKRPKTVSEHARRGHIPGASRVFGHGWRFDADVLEAWIASQAAGDPWRAPKGARS